MEEVGELLFGIVGAALKKEVCRPAEGPAAAVLGGVCGGASFALLVDAIYLLTLFLLMDGVV